MIKNCISKIQTAYDNIKKQKVEADLPENEWTWSWYYSKSK